MKILALDPSIVSPGVAWFVDGALEASACIKVKRDTSLTAGARCQSAVADIFLWGILRSPDLLVFEYPQIYAHDTPATANAVIHMAGVGVGLAERLHVPCITYVPGTIWGQLPKYKTGSYWKSPRGARIWDRLSVVERAVAGDQHDRGDAIGIGLFQLGRFGIRHAPFTSKRDH